MTKWAIILVVLVILVFLLILIFCYILFILIGEYLREESSTEDDKVGHYSALQPLFLKIKYVHKQHPQYFSTSDLEKQLKIFREKSFKKQHFILDLTES